MLDAMTANRDQHIWRLASGQKSKIDDSKVPAPIKVVSNVGGGSMSSSAIKEGSTNYLSPKESLNRVAVRDDFEINLFADEKQFPELINPRYKCRSIPKADFGQQFGRLIRCGNRCSQ